MGVYKAAIVTESGQNLIAQALANEKPLIFTSAKTSSYSYPVGTNVPALTGLQDVVQSVMPFDSKVLGGNVAQVSVRFDNDGVDQTYRIETIGLYAKIEGGTETLFSVTQATTPDEMPVQSDISPSAYIYNIQHTVQNASQITLTVNPAGTATVQDIMDIETPEFDDSGTVEGISSFPSFLETMKSKMNFFQFFRNLKAGLQFVLHAGQIVNNCVTDNAGLPLSAAQGKVLKDLYTQLYSDSQTIANNLSDGLYGTTQDITLDQLMKYMSDWNHPFVFDIGYTLPIAPDKNNAIGIGEREMLHAFSYSGKHFYCIDSSKGWQESPYALKSNYLTKNDTVIASQSFAVGLTTFEVTDKIPVVPDGYERVSSILYTTQNYLFAQLAFVDNDKVFLTVNNCHPSLSINSEIRCVQLYKQKN